MGISPTNWHKRQATQIAAQLPDDPSDAWAVLSAVEQIQVFLFGPKPVPTPPEPDGGQSLLRFPGGGANSPSRRASSSGSASVLPK